MADADPLPVPDRAVLGRSVDGSSCNEVGVSMGTPTAGRRRMRGLVRSIGPELVSGASDNDPTNVGTAAAVGAATGYQLAWVALLVAPLLGVVQTIAAQVGSVARGNLQTLTLKRYGRGVAAVLLVSVVVVNVVTIAADLQAGAAGIGLLAGIDSRWLVAPLGLALIGLLLVGKYDEVVGVLRYLLLGFLAFAAAAYLAHPDWPRLIKSSLVPTLTLRHDVIAGALALLGTTLTSYVYVWETIERGDEEPPDTTTGLARARQGAVIAAVATAVILWFMYVAAAATLGQQHQAVATAQDAAKSLRPLAGPLAENVFAVGLVVSAVVALPVLMATTAYVVGAQFDWRRGLSEQVSNAWRFYGVLAASVGLAVAVSLANVSVIDILVAASVVGGFGTPIGIAVLVLLGRDHAVMGARRISGRLAVAGWTVAAIVAGFGLVYVIGAALGEF
ncbi:MAG TPA: divalent metal cation transporter [Mycobacterium sp.]|nr:divalent metal cation transporter [Mycobacterium sp.]HUH69885.1 divalent metal cation transporter [Mycobacterium sp.]